MEMDQGENLDQVTIQERKYREQLQLKTAITDQERQQVVNACVDKDGNTLEKFACNICFNTLFDPVECKECETATFCSPCSHHYLQSIQPKKECPLRGELKLGKLHKFKMNDLNS